MNDTIRWAYNLGQLAYVSGVPRFNNPYPVGTKESDEWERGWDDARQSAEEAKKGQSNEEINQSTKGNLADA